MAAMPLGMLPSCFLETEAQPATVLPGIALGANCLAFTLAWLTSSGLLRNFPLQRSR
jgi:hypothetical protein